jgi:hypothetical protein
VRESGFENLVRGPLRKKGMAIPFETRLQENDRNMFRTLNEACRVKTAKLNLKRFEHVFSKGLIKGHILWR